MKATGAQNMKTNLKRIDVNTKQLGNSDLSITPVGFGAWAIGGSGWEFGRGEPNDKHMVSGIHRALGLGANLINTAAAFVIGHPGEPGACSVRTLPGPSSSVFSELGLDVR